MGTAFRLKSMTAQSSNRHNRALIDRTYTCLVVLGDLSAFKFLVVVSALLS